jgi:hypothetical protein
MPNLMWLCLIATKAKIFAKVNTRLNLVAKLRGTKGKPLTLHTDGGINSAII